MYHRFLEYLLSNDSKKVISSAGIRLRKLIYPVLRVIAPLSTKNRLKIVQKAPLPKHDPVIFACSHGFKDDVLFSALAAQKSAYILFGGLERFFHTSDGLMLWLNGVILLDRDDRNSRRASIDKMIYAIRNGASIILFPEGSRNRTANLPVQRLFSGVYDVVKETGAFVIPLVTHIDNGICYVSRGPAFDLGSYDREKGLMFLRDQMATAKWELVEDYSPASRATVLGGKSRNEYWKEYIRAMVTDRYGRDMKDCENDFPHGKKE